MKGTSLIETVLCGCPYCWIPKFQDDPVIKSRTCGILNQLSVFEFNFPPPHPGPGIAQ